MCLPASIGLPKELGIQPRLKEAIEVGLGDGFQH
jgi:hypothetical protein